MTEAGKTVLEPWLLEVLACPACRSPLREHAGPESAELLCTGCGRAYPVRDGIPVLLVDEARLTGSGSAAPADAPPGDAAPPADGPGGSAD